MFLMGVMREFLGSGSFFGISVFNGAIDPILIFILPPGGFFFYGVFIAIANRLSKNMTKPQKTYGCGACNGCAQQNESE